MQQFMSISVNFSDDECVETSSSYNTFIQFDKWKLILLDKIVQAMEIYIGI